MKGARITAIGSYVPSRRLTNHDLEQMVDTNDEWIVQRTVYGSAESAARMNIPVIYVQPPCRI